MIVKAAAAIPSPCPDERTETAEGAWREGAYGITTAQGGPISLLDRPPVAQGTTGVQLSARPRSLWTLSDETHHGPSYKLFF